MTILTVEDWFQLPKEDRPAGIAVSGEVSLHAEWFYLWVCKGCDDESTVIWRKCEGLEDYGYNYPNNDCDVAELDDVATFANRLTRLRSQ